MQLSLEDNQIESLDNFPELKNLMELYLGNNHIQESKEITNLKNLQKLIILDLSGNPFSKDPNYRYKQPRPAFSLRTVPHVTRKSTSYFLFQLF